MGKRSSHSIEKGIGFGVTSGVITTLGMMVGLDAGTNSSLAVIVGVFAVAISDSLSDAMGVHNAEEVSTRRSKKDLWQLTFATFLSKFFFTLTFAVPVLLLDLPVAILVSVIWGMALIAAFSYYLAISKKKAVGPVLTVHLFMTMMVILVTYFVGKLISYASTFLQYLHL